MLSLRSVTTGGAFRAAPSHAHEKTPTGGPCTPGAGRWCPEENASFLSRLLFLYVGGLVRMGYLKTLHQEDLWDVAVQVCMGYILSCLSYVLRPGAHGLTQDTAPGGPLRCGRPGVGVYPRVASAFYSEVYPGAPWGARIHGPVVCAKPVGRFGARGWMGGSAGRAQSEAGGRCVFAGEGEVGRQLVGGWLPGWKGMRTPYCVYQGRACDLAAGREHRQQQGRAPTSLCVGDAAALVPYAACPWNVHQAAAHQPFMWTVTIYSRWRRHPRYVHSD